MKWLRNLFKSKKKEKWRLTPNKDGLYTLEKYHYDIGSYLCEAVNTTPEKAEEYIKNLERSRLYLEE